MRRTTRLSIAAPLVVPGALVVFFSFSGGGFFPTAPALVAIGLAIFLVLRLTLAANPFAGASRALGVTVAALGLFAAWTLLSATWGTPARALLEYDRALAYLLALVAFGSLAGGPERLAWMVRWLTLGIVVVAAAALTTWLLPEVWSVDPGSATDRLSYPLTYWNALGLLCALGCLLALHLTTSAREPRTVRVFGAAVMPILVVALYFTFSRGALGAGAVGVVVLLAATRPRAFVSGLLAAGPASAVALAAAYGADALSGDTLGLQQTISEREDVAITVGAAVVGAALVRLIGLRLDAWLERRAATRERRPLRRIAAAWGGALALVLVVALVAQVPASVARQYDRFVEGEGTQSSDLRERYSDPGNNGRLDLWRVAVESSEGERFKGTGAGTFATLWTQRRPLLITIVDGHSLYLEVLAELGVVGLALLLVTILGILGGFAVRARGEDRGPPGALLAAGVAWALHAGIDWHWEMPAVTFWLFALGGAALAAPAGAARLKAPRRMTRIVLALGVLVLATTPVLVAWSQSKLDDAVQAFKAFDCRAAIDDSLASLSALNARPEPFELMGYCDVRLGLDDLAVRNLEQAVERDPDNWELHYGLALVRGAVGREAAAAARRALELNPREPIAQEAVEQLSGGRRAARQRRARLLPLPGALR